ncbi:hypothetical protein Taro_055208 [Colocasia esculenta]|uniref:Uncharacterized protein n=1 Tax=Colocasia esculenta TaxID=4460 RepID=A0A843XSY1_COLES|nr:hypothetical protein [Colocasia esculenta]
MGGGSTEKERNWRRAPSPNSISVCCCNQRSISTTETFSSHEKGNVEGLSPTWAAPAAGLPCLLCAEDDMDMSPDRQRRPPPGSHMFPTGLSKLF